MLLPFDPIAALYYFVLYGFFSDVRVFVCEGTQYAVVQEPGDTYFGICGGYSITLCIRTEDGGWDEIVVETKTYKWKDVTVVSSNDCVFVLHNNQILGKYDIRQKRMFSGEDSWSSIQHYNKNGPSGLLRKVPNLKE